MCSSDSKYMVIFIESIFMTRLILVYRAYKLLCDSALHIPACGARWPGGIVTDSVARYLRPSCCVLEQRHIYSPKSTGNTQEAMARSKHD